MFLHILTARFGFLFPTTWGEFSKSSWSEGHCTALILECEVESDKQCSEGKTWRFRFKHVSYTLLPQQDLSRAIWPGIFGRWEERRRAQAGCLRWVWSPCSGPENISNFDHFGPFPGQRSRFEAGVASSGPTMDLLSVCSLDDSQWLCKNDNFSNFTGGSDAASFSSSSSSSSCRSCCSCSPTCRGRFFKVAFVAGSTQKELLHARIVRTTPCKPRIVRTRGLGCQGCSKHSWGQGQVVGTTLLRGGHDHNVVSIIPGAERRRFQPKKRNNFRERQVVVRWVLLWCWVARVGIIACGVLCMACCGLVWCSGTGANGFGVLRCGLVSLGEVFQWGQLLMVLHLDNFSLAPRSVCFWYPFPESSIFPWQRLQEWMVGEGSVDMYKAWAVLITQHLAWALRFLI